CRAQATQSDAHLMDAFGVAGKDCRFVGDYLLETSQSNRSERGARRHVRRKVNGLAFRDRSVLAGEKFVAALRLAFDGKFGGRSACNCSRELEQTCSIASLQLKFGLAQRQRAVAGVDFTAVDRQCNIAVLAGERIARALHAGFEDRAQFLALFLDSQWFECGCIRPFQVRAAVCDGRFPFAAFERAAVIGLDGLGVAVAAAPNAQRQTARSEVQAFGVEIDRDLIFASLRPAFLAAQGPAPEPREIGGWGAELYP